MHTELWTGIVAAIAVLCLSRAGNSSNRPALWLVHSYLCTLLLVHCSAFDDTSTEEGYAIGWIKFLQCDEGSITEYTYPDCQSWDAMFPFTEHAITAQLLPRDATPSQFDFTNSPTDDFAVMLSVGSSPVSALNEGLELSWSYDPETLNITGYADMDDWLGSDTAKERLSNSCFGENPPQLLESWIYYACGNFEGIRISSTNCWWDWQTETAEEGISVWLGFDRTQGSFTLALIHFCTHRFNRITGNIARTIDRCLCDYANEASFELQPEHEVDGILLGTQIAIEFFFILHSKCNESLCSILQIGSGDNTYVQLAQTDGSLLLWLTFDSQLDSGFTVDSFLFDTLVDNQEHSLYLTLNASHRLLRIDGVVWFADEGDFNRTDHQSELQPIYLAAGSYPSNCTVRDICVASNAQGMCQLFVHSHSILLHITHQFPHF